MRSLLRVAVTAVVAAAVAAITPVWMAPAAHASSSAGVFVAIDSVSPRYARPDSTIVVTGTVTNGTGTAVPDLVVQLFSSQSWFTTRSGMEAYVAGTGQETLTAVGNQETLTTSLRPGGTATWRLKFPAAIVGFSQFGVYPLQAEAINPISGSVAVSRTLLPFWPDSTSAIAKLKIGWVWPLIDQPHQQPCPVLTNDDLEQSLAAGGRLHTLLAAAAAAPQADVTWAVDPALLGDASTMTSPYQVAGSDWNPADCTGATSEPASSAASGWLATLKSVTSGQPMVITPYGNTDVAALTHQGPNADLKTAYLLGQEVAGQVLHRSFSPMALPPAGLADQSVLTALATSEHVTNVVLSSSEMPLTDSSAFGDDAVTSLRTGAGTQMNVLLADDTLTSLLKSASGSLSAGTQFDIEQQFLAETAMISSESPGSSRSVVVSPPETWGPSQALAQDLLTESSQAPWLEPVTLSSLAGSHDSESQLPRKSPSATSYSPRELSSAYLAAVSKLDARLDLYTSMLYQAPRTYTTSLSEAIAATESSAWRGNTAPGQALVAGFSAYLTNVQKNVRILTSPEITMAGASGVLPVTIENSLDHDVQVKLSASVPVAEDTNGDAPPLKVGQLNDLITIQAGTTVVEKIHVSSAPSGSTAIQLQLTSKDGRSIPHSDVSLTVHSTRYGQAILILIYGAIGLLVLSSLFRAGRRWLNAPGGEG